MILEQAVPRNQLQLTAVTCVMIAAKHEENSRVPSARDFTHIADNCFKVSLSLLPFGIPLARS